MTLVILLSSFDIAPVPAASSTAAEDMYADILNQGLSDKALLNAIEGYGELKTKNDLEKETLIVKK